MNKPMERFLRNQTKEALQLAQRCPLFDLRPMEPDPVSRYLVRFNCRGLVKEPDGRIVEESEFWVKIRFPKHYLNRTSTFEVITWAGPDNIFHPNVFVGARDRRMARAVCIGDLGPGTPLTRILVQLHNVIRYWNYSTIEQDALNPDACVWARNNMDRLPIDDRQLVWIPPVQPNEGEEP
jgi:hypothetical protein